MVGKMRHRARFHYCKAKIQRIHDVCQKTSGEMPLCPICIDFLPSPRHSETYIYWKAENIVTFLCGHRYHLDCANSYVAMDPKTQQCPACDNGVGGCLKNGDEVEDDSGNGESKAFMLRSLRGMFPDIISHEEVQRWRSCHTESWIVELRCPHYVSIWNREDN